MSRSLVVRLVSGLAAAGLLFASPTTGQVRRQALSSPDATFPEPFTRIVGVRELSDGRVLIADRTELHVSFIDFATGAVDQVGRQGKGPGEYEMPTGLFPWPDDGALLVDLANTRMTRITSEGRLDESWPVMSSSGRFINPSATDQLGRVYYSSAGSFMMGPGAPPPSDSQPVVRWDPATDTHDTVAMLFSQPRITASRGGGGGGFSVRTGSGGGMRLSGMRRQPFRPVDAWGIAPNGDVMVVRATDYRVDWYRDGRMTSGPANPYDPVRITQAEKEAWADGQEGQAMTMMVLGGSGGGQTLEAPRPNLDEVDFPEVKPAFQATGTSVTPDGEVWVRRYQRHDAQQPLYDVFDGQGVLIKQVRLAPGRTIVGFGENAVYTVFADEDDLQWLERYAR